MHFKVVNQNSKFLSHNSELEIDRLEIYDAEMMHFVFFIF